MKYFSDSTIIFSEREFEPGRVADDAICLIAEFVRNIRQGNRINLEILKRPEGAKGFQVVAKLLVVERIFAWLSFHRRMSKDHEYLPETRVALIRIATIRLTPARLT